MPAPTLPEIRQIWRGLRLDPPPRPREARALDLYREDLRTLEDDHRVTRARALDALERLDPAGRVLEACEVRRRLRARRVPVPDPSTPLPALVALAVARGALAEPSPSPPPARKPADPVAAILAGLEASP